MSGKTNSDRITRRRQATIDEIVAAAWGLVRERGLAGLSMRELGARVGMRAQSLYSYFASKDEIYDAMFLEGNQAFVEAMRDVSDRSHVADDPTERARSVAHRFFRFCTDDPVRYQLLFQRTIPDFIPSKQSYAVAREGYDLAVAGLRAMGADDAGIDLWTAVLGGLVGQQISNDPGGVRWAVLVDRAVDMLASELTRNNHRPEDSKSRG